MRTRMRIATLAALAAAPVAVTLTAGAAAAGPAPRALEHVGTFSVPANLAPGEAADTVTSAEIVDYALGGTLLLYTDSPTGRLGFVDIVRPSAPVAAGTIDVGGEPTSVAVRGLWALVAVNTSTSYDSPSGELAVVNVVTRRIVRRISLAGQPDSVAIAPSGRYAAVVIENERDEDENDGLIPQPPAGTLEVLDLRGVPGSWTTTTVDLTGLALVAPDDPEPEYVDINTQDEAVVTLQENNHLVIVDLRTASVANHFPAGSAVLANVDATEEKIGPQKKGLIELDETITRRREPDGVAWIDRDTFATANEGDYEDGSGEEGGARGFTLFNEDGTVEYESGSSFEHELVRAGHYPEGRSANKGNEPEGIEVGRYLGRTFLLVGSERANAVGVYDVTGGTPVFVQVIPTGIGPEGLKAIPGRNLLAVSAEVDGKEDGFDVRSLITLYRARVGPAPYPYLQSADAGGVPIPWVAISGLAGDPSDPGAVWAVSDSFLAQAYVYRIDVTGSPAVIRERIPVGPADGLLDLEGVAARPEGGLWLASEGRVGARANAILRVDAAGTILDTVALPTALAAGAVNFGLEGVAVTGSEAGGDETVWVVFQREWATDPAGLVKIGRYEVATGVWTFAHYPLDAVESPNGGWVGLSEITLLPDGTVAIAERDDQLALDTRVKRIYGVDLADPGVVWQEYTPGVTLDVVGKTLLRDVLGDLDARSISVPDKLEGVAVTADGTVYLATDNDGLDENYGETLFFDLGSVSEAFGF